MQDLQRHITSRQELEQLIERYFDGLTTVEEEAALRACLARCPWHSESIEDAQVRKDELKFNVGDTVRVSAMIKEGNRSRIQVFEGTVIKKQGTGARKTFTVRKNSNGVGVEKTWPMNSPLIEKVEVVRLGKARRAKLFYLRDRIGKRAKVKEIVR